MGTPFHVVVVAGGSGMRYGPAGRASKPEQVLALDDESRMRMWIYGEQRMGRRFRVPCE